MKVLVIGDIILDKYYFGTAERISPEAPVPIVKVDNDENRLGGAANVAINLSKMKLSVDLLGVVGFDQDGSLVLNKVNESGITWRGFQVNDFATISKTRILANAQQLIRLDKECIFDGNIQKRIDDIFFKIFEQYELIVFSDYAKGTLGNCSEKLMLSKNSDITTIVDPKSHIIENYSYATYIKPNLKELSNMLKFRNHNNFNVADAEEFYNQFQRFHIQNLIISMSELGAMILSEDTSECISTKVREVVDVTGAGDVLIAAFVKGLSFGLTKIEALRSAVALATLSTQEVGTYCVSEEDFLKTLNDVEKEERTVFTNGCFDLLHTGHIDYLRRAKELGDKLIVGLNSDASVKRLKGKDRPINNEIDRKAMLLALKCVDDVIIFEEDTPIKLIEKILPNILVKGGDYNTSEIVGADVVYKNGGQVITMDFIDGYSTSSLIKRIQK